MTFGTSVRGFDGHRLVHHALLVGVVAHFDVADQREVLAERMADETVVGEDAAQIRVTGEQDAEQVEGFALEPVGARPDVDHRIDDGIFGVLAARANAQALVVGDRQQLVGNRETRAVVRQTRAVATDTATESGSGRRQGLPLARRVVEVVDAGQVDEDFELEFGIVAQRQTDAA